MAVSKQSPTDLRQLFSDTPDRFRGILAQLNSCYDLYRSVDVPILKQNVQQKIEQCAGEFKAVCRETEVIADMASIGWMIIQSNPSFVQLFAQEHSKEIAQRFQNVSDHIRRLSGRFHDCEKLVETDKQMYMTKVQKAVDEASAAKIRANKAKEEAERKSEAAEETSSKWAIAAVIPLVNIVGLPGYMIAASKAAEAREKLLTEMKSSIIADLSSIVEKMKFQKAKCAAGILSELIDKLKVVEELCNFQVFFWGFEADKCHSLKQMALISKEFAQIGIEVDTAKDEILQQREQFTKYCEKMAQIRGRTDGTFNSPLLSFIAHMLT